MDKEKRSYSHRVIQNQESQFVINRKNKKCFHIKNE